VPRILLDENIPRSIADWLVKKGYTVARTSDIGLRGKSDTALIRFSQTESMIIVTLDEDFIKLHRQFKKPFGAIVVRTHPATPSKVERLLRNLLSNVKIEKYTKDLLIITDAEIRIESST
jgi:predicted nuclease of predicted toxin-antitoxin system